MEAIREARLFGTRAEIPNIMATPYCEMYVHFSCLQSTVYCLVVSTTPIYSCRPLEMFFFFFSFLFSETIALNCTAPINLQEDTKWRRQSLIKMCHDCLNFKYWPAISVYSLLVVAFVQGTFGSYVLIQDLWLDTKRNHLFTFGEVHWILGDINICIELYN